MDVEDLRTRVALVEQQVSTLGANLLAHQGYTSQQFGKMEAKLDEQTRQMESNHTQNTTKLNTIIEQVARKEGEEAATEKLRIEARDSKRFEQNKNIAIGVGVATAAATLVGALFYIIYLLARGG